MNLLRHIAPRPSAAVCRPLYGRRIATSARATISDAVGDDHRQLRAYYHKLVGELDADTKERYKNQFSWLLAKHAVSEELVLYPAYEKYLGAFGRQAADRDRESHQKAPPRALPRLRPLVDIPRRPKTASSTFSASTRIPASSRPSCAS